MRDGFNSVWTLKTPVQHAVGLYMQGRYRVTLDYLEANPEKLKQSGVLLNIAALCAMALELTDEAEHYWMQAISVAPVLVAPYFHLANLYNSRKDFDRAEDYYKKALVYDPHYVDAYNNYASLLYNCDRYVEAENYYRLAITMKPDHPDLYNNLGVLLKVQKRNGEAEECYRKALALQPNYVSAYGNLGRLYADMDRSQEAEISYQKSIELNPNFAASYFNLALLYVKLKRYDEAETCYRKVIELEPDNLEAYGNLGNMLVDIKRYQDAELCYHKAISLNPKNLHMYSNLGNLFSRTRYYKEAEASYLFALSKKPDFAEAHYNFANMLLSLKRYDEAEEHYLAVMKYDPQFSGAYFNYGNLLKELGRLNEAENAYHQALVIKPDYAGVYSNLGNLFKEQNRLEEAEAAYRKAIEIDPSFVEGHSNLGVYYKRLKKYPQAEECYRKALAIDPMHPETRFNMSLVVLAQARFDEGWRHYESRYDSRMDKPIATAPILPFPRWQGESLVGKSIIFWHEQGFGDVIQFARYVDLIKRQGAAHISFMCKKPLKRLFQTLKGIDNVMCFEESSNLGLYDYWTFPLSVPLYLQTRLENIPADVGYLSPPSDVEKKWRKLIPAKGFKVGVAWKGSTEHTGDADRSLSDLGMLEKLWNIPGITFISLQKGRDEDEAEKFSATQPILNLGAQMEDFADASAIVKQLDLLICVDTAIAHLAGALNIPVWVLVPYIPDWRWMMDREDSPWYPSIRLFRQQERGNWGQVIDRVASELKKIVPKQKLSLKAKAR